MPSAQTKAPWQLFIVGLPRFQMENLARPSCQIPIKAFAAQSASSFWLRQNQQTATTSRSWAAPRAWLPLKSMPRTLSQYDGTFTEQRMAFTLNWLDGHHSLLSPKLAVLNPTSLLECNRTQYIVVVFFMFSMCWNA